MLDQLLTVKEVASRLSVDVTTIWRWKRENNFPEPVKLGEKTTRWRESDVQKWVKANA